MVQYSQSTEFILEPDIYIIIDPSYLFSDKLINLCISRYNTNNHGDTISKFDFGDGKHLYMIETAYGAGLYPIVVEDDETNNTTKEINIDYFFICVANSKLVIDRTLKQKSVGEIPYLVETAAMTVCLHNETKLQFVSKGDMRLGKFFINTSSHETESYKLWMKSNVNRGKVTKKIPLYTNLLVDFNLTIVNPNLLRDKFVSILQSHCVDDCFGV